MKKIAIAFASLLLATSLVGCGDATPPPEEDPPTPTVCEHVYTEQVTKEALALADGVMTYTCSKCGDTYEEAIPATKSIKILGIGNSYTEDTFMRLWDVCKSGGIENVKICFLFIGGTDFVDHWNNIQNDAAKYTWYENTNGLWKQSTGYSISKGLAKDDWDIITVQNGSSQSGQPYEFEPLGSILNYLEQNKPEKAKIWHNMTWAYQADSKEPRFAQFSYDQMTMYNAIVSTAQEKVLPQKSIAGIVPCGTAVQNVRTSYIGDTLFRDDLHLSFGIGRYIASLTYFAAVSGGNVRNVTWVPDDNAAIRATLPVLYEAVENAIENKFSVTPSSFIRQ